jgi:hypothetical protein
MEKDSLKYLKNLSKNQKINVVKIDISKDFKKMINENKELLVELSK